MAPMITDSYYNDMDFGNKSTGKFYNTANKPPLPSLSYSMNDQQKLTDPGYTFGFRRAYTEDAIIDILRGNNFKQQCDLLEELIVQCLNEGADYQILNIKNLEQFYTAFGHLLTNTISNEVQRLCVKFLQSYFKLVDKLKQRRKSDSKSNEKFKQIDSKVSNTLLDYLIQSSVSPKLQLKTFSIDLIYSYMKLTDDVNAKCFEKFIKFGIENTDPKIARQFIDPTLGIFFTSDFQNSDYSLIIKSLTNKLTSPLLQQNVLNCLHKLENLLKKDKFISYINKLPLTNRNNYLDATNQVKSSVQFKNQTLIDSLDTEENMKFNLIPARILQKLSGEDELQRLKAINSLEQSVKELTDIKTVYPYYQDFILYMSEFINDANYEIRLCSIKILTTFIKKLGPNINQCYKAIGACARSVMNQTNQSKTIRQAMTSMMITAIERMSSPVLILEALLEKVRDRSAKTREDTLNLVIACVLKFPNDKFESMRKIFFLVSPLICDIKRSVRHASLECLAIILNRLKQIDRNAGNIVEQLEHVPFFEKIENLNIIKDVIIYRVNRNALASLNSDMSLDYGVKIPSSGATFSVNGLDLDIEWIISASSSSASASNVSSARSQKSVCIDTVGSNSNQNSMHRISNLNQNNAQQISTVSFRRPSASKRLPWEESNPANNFNQVPKVNRSREVAPLKAFPLNDEFDVLTETIVNNSSNTSTNMNKTGYPSTTSYQEKYLKKLKDQQIHQSKTDSQIDLSDYSNNATKLQSEKAHSLDNLYNFDDSINSENNVQKRKYANLNLKNGIIPSKPIIPRRNSANRYNVDTANDSFSSQNNSYAATNRSNFDSEQESIYSGETDNKFDTGPSIRGSAKNRRRLDKMFAISSNNNSNYAAPPNSNTNLFDSKNFRSNPNLSLNNYRKETNSYLAKLNPSENNTSRYTPSNPESGIFSLSDYENSNNQFIKLEKSQNNPEHKKMVNGNKDIQNKASGSNIEYKPLAGVSFKPSHPGDVEIVGVKLGNQTIQDQSSAVNSNALVSNQKKKNSLKSMNDLLNENDTLNGYQGDMLDIVGRGYLANYEANFGQENFEHNPTQEEYRLSSSFCSRVRQKTMERDEEKQKKKKKKELETLNSNLNLQSPNFLLYEYENQKADKNFGLSISGYPSGKTPTNGNPEIEEEKKSKYSTYDLTNLDYLEEQYNSPSSNLPFLDKPKFQPTKATQARIKARQAAAEFAKNDKNPNDQAQEYSISSPAKTRKKLESGESDTEIVTRVVKEDFVKQPFKNAESAFKEAMNYLSQENWENKCNAMNIIRRLSVYHEDIAVENIHSIVIALVQEVKNLRSQVSRFALMTFGELFVNLKKNMDVDLDIAIKAILQKLSETSEFIRVDIEKCLEKMINNVTTTKAIVALINGGASHRNPVIRRVAAQYVYKCCEIMGPGRILSGIKDVTEKVLLTAAQFVVDGPVDIRWYGRKIFHILMSHDDFDRLLIKYLNDKTRKNIKEILDTIKVKGPGEVPTESAKNSRKAARIGSDLITRSAGSNSNIDRVGTAYGIAEPRAVGSRPTNYPPPLPPSLRVDQQSQEYVKSMCAQMRNTDFRERMDAIEKFQVLCEQEPEIAIVNLVQIFDKFNLCLTDSNSKVNYKALNTMYLITPLLRDDLNSVLVNVIPLIAQSLASKNSEIQDMASNILDTLVEYLDGGSLIQPFANLAIHGNARVKPQIVFKLSDLVAKVYQRKQKQVDMHILPALWQLLNLVKGSTMSAGVNSLNFSITRLVMSLYEHMGEQLIEKASSNSSVSSRNLETLKQILTSQLD